jgi:hypothetical protein
MNLRFISFLFLTATLSAQQVPRLFGLHTTGSATVFAALDVSNAAYNAISTQTAPYSSVVDKTTFDRVGARYFIKSGDNIYVFNALNGVLLDSIPSQSNFHNIEYDAISNTLVGIEIFGSNYVFKSINLITKLSQLKGTLSAVDSLVIGESTFDTQNRRYFTLTNLGLVSVDATGKIADVLCASPKLNGIEYDRITNKIYYLDWNGSAYDFIGIEANTCTIGLIGYYIGLVTVWRGESTFNSALGHYFARTNFGIMELDTQTGQVIQTITAPNNFAHMEYADLSTVGIEEARFLTQGMVYPNPSSGFVNFGNLELGASVELRNVAGESVLTQLVNESNFSLNLQAFTKGIYFYRIQFPNNSSRQGKLILR